MRLGILTPFLLILAGTLSAAPPASAPATQSAPAKAMLWTFKSPTATVYVMGSLHLAGKELYPLAPEIEEAFAASKALVVEANVTGDNRKEADAIIRKKGFQPEGKYLTDSLDSKTILALRKICGKANVNFETIDAMKPWFAAMYLEVAALKAAGFDSSLGIDTHFMNAAQKRKMKILELESLTIQFDLMTSLGDKEQALMLQATIRDCEQIKERVPKIQAAWIAGDMKNLDSTAGEPDQDPLSQKITRLLVTDRNIKMADKIETYLKGDETLFVIMGEGHLGGDKGVLALLKQKGYPGEQLTLKKKPGS